MKTAALNILLRSNISHFSDDDQARIIEAALWAQEAHAPQIRDDGTPYVDHLYHVALIALEHHQGADTVIASLLHDIVEDTPVSLSEVKARFGERVATIVEGVTKAEKAHFADPDERKAATYMNLIVAATTRPESLTVKLCDRLHNVRTFGSTSREKATRKALETLEVYAPLAYSLSHHYIYRELEDRCMEILEPEKMHLARQAREQIVKARKGHLLKMADQISNLLSPHNVEIEVALREKHLTSLVRKTKDGVPPQALHDVVALVIVTETIPNAYLALGAAHQLYQPLPGKVKDFIALPKNNGYQSLHSIVYNQLAGFPVEVQIRTPQMVRHAEWGAYEPALSWISKDRPQDPKGFLASLKSDLFREEIYVFSPDGSAHCLPQGSTLAFWLAAQALEPDISVYHHGRLIDAEETLVSGMTLTF